ncbi:hypothetical protein N1078_18745 [Pseudomonas sp. MIL19]|uniref:hypothetical protein n=1 Tax=Pseudomonas sp. MIL19 TaxID=2976979 RepID=UPI002364204A|nr:hypothetical protein [Pseudomonas sp. MIL19]MDD2162602.1 hypothetical protein [Pseudomonas sp. MIL19]
MKAFNLALFLLLGSVSAPYALADDGSKHLINSCQQLLNVYSKRDQQNLLAGITTSTSAALRAGYCLGVLDEYRRSGSFCAQSDWYAQAARIAEYPAYADELPSVDALLEQSCAL